MKKFKLFTQTLIYGLSCGFCVNAVAQTAGAGTNTNGSSTSAITTAVPFLTISPDSRSGAMGDAGAAISPDVNATYWNPAKLAYLENSSNMAVSYDPWLRNIVPDVYLAYLSFAGKLDERGSIGASLRYFNMGSIELYDIHQNPLGVFKPNEFSLDVSYARKFGDNFSLGLTGRYIHSDLTNGSVVEGQQTKAANDFAADVSLYIKNPTRQFGKDALFAFGVDISNIGPKLSYTANGQQFFLPTNLKIGVANTWFLDESNEVTLALDINKLLVPTPPVRDANGNVISGKDDNRSVVSGIFGSFSDAPGGLGEEFKEISFSPAFEYTYNKQFSLRSGYFYENPDKGNRQYFTLGAGIKYSEFKFDFSYLIAAQDQSPLANTLRFTLHYNFGSK